MHLLGLSVCVRLVVAVVAVVGGGGGELGGASAAIVNRINARSTALNARGLPL